MQPDVGAYQKEHLKKLAERKNTVVFEVEHDNVANPWKNDKMRGTVERLMKKVMEEFDEDLDDFDLRKKCLEDPSILEFQRVHQKFFWMLTDRKMMKEQKYRDAIKILLHMHSEVEEGLDVNEANAKVTNMIMKALHDEGR